MDHLAGGVAPGNPVEDHLVAVLRLVPLRKDSRVIVLENAVSNFVADEKKKQDRDDYINLFSKCALICSTLDFLVL